ncbi:MAG: hypothetical protein QXW01_01940 [Candidatus Aenigmatarchaeota archaeon]
MKAQTAYEFYVVFFIFISVVLYLTNYIISYRNIYIKEVKREKIFGEAYKISQFLVNDVGEPENWYLDINNAKRIGLAYSTKYFNHISATKVSVFNFYCRNNYNLIKKLLNVDVDFSVFLITNDGQVLIDCIRPFGEETIEIKRIVSLDDGKTYGVMKIWVY